MISEVRQPALICPYTLLEEEALAWAVLLFGQVVLLHPYPLPVPASCLEAANRNWIQVRTLPRTREEIRKKDKFLTEMDSLLANTPGRGYLKYLQGAASLEDTETREEIVSLMRGRLLGKNAPDGSAVNGPILLCWIHNWMRQEWEVEASLAEIEEREKIMALGWQENLEEEWPGESTVPRMVKKTEIEIHCPPALVAWRELKKSLVSEPMTLVTNQIWVWKSNYNLDPEEDRTVSIPLPDLGSLEKAASQNHSLMMSIREKWERVLHPPGGSDQERILVDFQESLTQLGLPVSGKYRLTFPPDPVSMKALRSSAGNKESDRLILFSPALV
jgi:hypothetical protein